MSSKSFTLLPSARHFLVGSRPGSVLLETARFDGDNARSYLFVDPVQILSIQHLDEVPALFAQIESSLAQGQFVAGFLAYECGYHFENIGHAPRDSRLPLAWLGVYDAPQVFDHARGEFEGESATKLKRDVARAPSPADFAISDCRLTISESRYGSAIEAIKNYIAAGDTYQVNFTDELRFEFSGTPAAMFTALQARQPVSYAAFLNLGGSLVLSFSPELFFRVHEGKIVTRPMKGTAPRGRYLAEDRELARWLANDHKNRSENVMIVDLLRNDLGRVCETGSVRVNPEEMFVVEKYETLLQMTSTVSGRLKRGLRWYDIFQSLFPCGSVTGAPKIRTMRIIRELEQRARGVYTGAIGYFSPKGDAAFNVAIRTVVLDEVETAARPRSARSGSMGVGSGIVFDSVAEDEYRECRLKADFLTQVSSKDGSCYVSSKDFQLIESMLWEGGFPLLELHFNRLRDSAEYFGFVLDEAAVRARLADNERDLRRGIRYKVRLLLNRTGELTLDNVVLDDGVSTGRVMLSPVAVCSADRFLYHKTTRRELFDRMYAEARRQGCDDIIFTNERTEITEGAISNIFVERDGRLYTPPISCGLLPGVYRQHVLATDARAEERVLKPKDIENADALYICNAVRGLRKVTLAAKAAAPTP